MTAHPVYTPTAVDGAYLDSVTVGHRELIERLTTRIERAAHDGSRPHTLLIAPHGGGKTHSLHVAIHRALASESTADIILPLWIPEDSLAIGCYPDMLVELARSIGPDAATAARAHRRDRDVIGLERSIMDAAEGRMILVAVENLDRVFDSLGQAGQGSFRAWVETSSAVLIYATSPLLFSGVSSRSYPWYGSFIVEDIGEFDVAESTEMLVRSARRRGDEELAAFVGSPDGQDRLRVIHRLAGGSPRLWHIMSDCMDVSSLEAVVPAVEALLDRLAPYYQQRLWQLAAGEQRLIVELARDQEPRTVSDLAAAVGVSNQSAATALGRLAAARWVRSAKSATGDRRSSWYDLTDPLLRYHVQYREGRSEQLRLVVEDLRSISGGA